MMDWLLAQIARAPKQAMALGRTLLGLGALMLVSGLIARAGLNGINAERANGNLPALRAISEAYPSVSLWFVPQTFFGYFTAGLFAIAGVYLVLQARRMLKGMEKRS